MKLGGDKEKWLQRAAEQVTFDPHEPALVHVCNMAHFPQLRFLKAN